MVTPIRHLNTSAQTRILLIEDNPDICDLTCITLRQAGYDVTCANSGAEALARLAEHPKDTDVVLLDFGLPDVSGRALYDAIQALVPGIPTIVSSGRSAVDIRRELPDAKLAGCLRKPYESDELTALIEASHPAAGQNQNL